MTFYLVRCIIEKDVHSKRGVIMKTWFMGKLRTGAEVLNFINTHNLLPGEFMLLEVTHGYTEFRVQMQPPEVRFMYYAEKKLV